MAATTARSAALSALERVRRGGAWSDSLMASCTAGLERRDAALAERIFLGVLQNAAYCDFCVGRYSSVKPERMEPKVLDILRISVYQILFMERIPPRAAVDEAVALTKRLGYSRASGLVNAILRRVAENQNSPPEPEGVGGAEYLSIKYSHPIWLAEEMCKKHGYDFAKRFFEANNTPAPVYVQTNRLKTDTGALVAALQAEGAEPRMHDWLPDCLVLAGNPAAYGAFRDGLMYVQDPAARLTVMAAGLKPGMRLLDACAAPGGKSFGAAIAMGNRGKILSRDLRDKKLRLIDEGAKRLGLDIIETAAMDARIPPPELFGQFDLVLADAPCSGLGVIRRKPEIRYKPREDLSALSEIQLDILRGLSKCVAPGGALLYSTCTVLEAENREVAERFLAENPEFCAEGFHLPGPVGDVPGGMASLWPHIHGTDGFFICKMRRR